MKASGWVFFSWTRQRGNSFAPPPLGLAKLQRLIIFHDSTIVGIWLDSNIWSWFPVADYYFSIWAFQLYVFGRPGLPDWRSQERTVLEAPYICSSFAFDNSNGYARRMSLDK